MPTKRTPIRRSMQRRITPAAVELFKLMDAQECTCPPRDWEGEYWKHEPCDGCEEWWRLHWELHRELGLGPHEIPYRAPHEQNPYPTGSAAAEHWRKKYAADTVEHERYAQLAEAAYGPAKKRPRPVKH
jgi:hypothetical protein